MNYAPIVIFTYRRTIKELIESLLSNCLAQKSDLIVFSDGYKNEYDRIDVLNVRKQIITIKGFSSVKIIESNFNKGLAKSVIDGVTEVINEYGKVIVLEDDLIVSKNFLEYMNKALDFYQDNENIWSISGYTPKLSCLQSYRKDLFLSYRSNSWGWATWKSRWNMIDWNISDYTSFAQDKKAVKDFNRGGNDLSVMLRMQMLGKIDSWAIRWCYNQYRYEKLSVYPSRSKVINNGFDAKGTHNKDGQRRWESELSSNDIHFEILKIDETIVKCFKQKYDLWLKTRLGYLLKEYGGYNIVKKIIKFLGNK